VQSQISALQQANEAMHIRRKRKRRVIRSDHVEAEVREEVLRPRKRSPTCSRCGQQGHTIRTCRVVE